MDLNGCAIILQARHARLRRSRSSTASQSARTPSSADAGSIGRRAATVDAALARMGIATRRRFLTSRQSISAGV
jgi:hypothetical protein